VVTVRWTEDEGREKGFKGDSGGLTCEERCSIAYGFHINWDQLSRDEFFGVVAEF